MDYTRKVPVIFLYAPRDTCLDSFVANFDMGANLV